MRTTSTMTKRRLFSHTYNLLRWTRTGRLLGKSSKSSWQQSVSQRLGRTAFRTPLVDALEGSEPDSSLLLISVCCVLRIAASRTVFIPKTNDLDANGFLIRAAEALHFFYNCACNTRTTAMCPVLRKCSVERIHPLQSCVTQRIMTHNVFEIETAAIAMRACCSDDLGVLLTDFSCARPSGDHRWIFMVLQHAGIPEPEVEHAGASRGQFATTRGERQGCPAGGILFTMAYD